MHKIFVLNLKLINPPPKRWVNCELNNIICTKHGWYTVHSQCYEQCEYEVLKQSSNSFLTYATYLKYVYNLIMVDCIFFRLFSFCFHRNKFQVLVTPKKEWVTIPGTVQDCNITAFLYPIWFFCLILWRINLFLLVTNISMGVEWPLSLLLKMNF